MKQSLLSGITTAIACCLWGFTSPSHAAWTSGQYGLVKYKLFTPDTSSPGKKFPFVLYLHPNGWQGDIDGVVNNIDKDVLPSVLSRPDSQAHNPCFIFAPECPRTVGGPSIAAWLAYSTNWQLGWDPNIYTINMSDSNYYTRQLKDVVHALDSMIARVSRIDTNRIHLAGGSMGANATMYLICRYPGRFASATAVAFNGDTARAKYIINTPMWLFWGDNDPTVAWQGAVLMKDAIVKAGGHPNFKQFPNTGHTWDQVWRTEDTALYQPNLIPWMFAQSKSSTPIAATVPARTSLNPVKISHHVRTILIRSSQPFTADVFSASGQLLAHRVVGPGMGAPIDLARGYTGVAHVRVTVGSRRVTQSVLMAD